MTVNQYVIICINIYIYWMAIANGDYNILYLFHLFVAARIHA